MSTVWFVLAVGGERQHGGNDGYDDDPSRHYSWDDTVPQHGNIAAGDVIALWDKKTLLGMSVIEKIDVGRAVKKVYFHEACGKADFKGLKAGDLRWWCNKCEVRFAERRSRDRNIRTFRSHHSRGWQDLAGSLTGQQIRGLCDKPRSQHSMRPARWEKVRAALQEVGATMPAAVTDKARAVIRGGRRPATVQVRDGQGLFRKHLLEEYGEVCAFSGPTPASAMEAAHLYSFADDSEHHEYGGFLLRRDLHRLFDLGHIAVNPETGRLDVGKTVRDYPLYGDLHGRELIVKLKTEQRVWIGAHWDKHRAIEQD